MQYVSHARDARCERVSWPASLARALCHLTALVNILDPEGAASGSHQGIVALRKSFLGFCTHLNQLSSSLCPPAPKRVPSPQFIPFPP